VGRMTVEDRLRLFNKIEFYDYYSLTPKRLELILKKNGIDLGFIVTFSKIIPKELLLLFTKGVFNFHPSLLPEHGGADPLFWTIYNHDKVWGITCHKATEKVDQGEILYQVKYHLNSEDSRQLFNKYLSNVANIIPLIIENYETFIHNKYKMGEVKYDPKIPNIDILKKEAEDPIRKRIIKRAVKLYKYKI